MYYFIDKVTASESLINLFRGKQDIKGPEFKMQVFWIWKPIFILF